MSICDHDGNFSSEFMQRLEDLKREQTENLRELEKLRVDAYLENRNMPHQPIDSRSNHNKAIAEMWSDFNLAETLRRGPTSSGDHLPKDIHAMSDFESDKRHLKEWRPTITVPEPFSMTVREETKPQGPKHTRASKEVEEARCRREAEAGAIRNDFRSRPVPAHVYYPLYHDIGLQSDNRRKLTFENKLKELAEKSSAPTFLQRDEQKKRKQAEKIRQTRDEDEHMIKILCSSFKARDVDPNILKPQLAQDDIDEDRYARIRARADKLMRSSSLPPRMGSAPGRIQRSSQLDHEAPRGRRERTERPIPDFKAIHQRNMRKLELTKKRHAQERDRARPKTAAPKLATAERSNAHKQAPLEENDPPGSREFKATKINFSPEAPPIRANDSFTRRKDFVKHTLDLMEDDLRKEKEELREKRRQQRARAKAIRKSLPPKANTHNQEKTKRELRQADLERQMSYRTNLNTIYTRVESRPCLFE